MQIPKITPTKYRKKLGVPISISGTVEFRAKTLEKLQMDPNYVKSCPTSFMIRKN
jgi:hypothetical protein